MSHIRYEFVQDPKIENLTNEEPLFSNTNLLYVAKACFNNDWHSNLHSHPYAELFYCLHGVGTFQVENEIIPVEQNDFILINSNIPHTERSVQDNPLEYLVLGIDQLNFSFPQHNQKCAIFHQANEDNQILSFLQMLWQEADLAHANWKAFCQSLLNVILTLILRQTQYDIHPQTASYTSKECALARRYIDEHYSENISLDHLSDITHVNKYYLVHAFQKSYGISPINYLIERRIQESKYLLKYTDYSLSQISNLLGFSSPSYFSQRFRHLTKQSPMEYRKQYRTKLHLFQEKEELSHCNIK